MNTAKQDKNGASLATLPALELARISSFISWSNISEACECCGVKPCACFGGV